MCALLQPCLWDALQEAFPDCSAPLAGARSSLGCHAILHVSPCVSVGACEACELCISGLPAHAGLEQVFVEWLSDCTDGMYTCGSADTHGSACLCVLACSQTYPCRRTEPLPGGACQVACQGCALRTPLGLWQGG